VPRGGIRPDMVTDQTSAHDLINGYLPWAGRGAMAGRAERPGAARRAEAGAGESCAVHVRAMLAFQAMGIPTVDYGNNIRQVAKDFGVERV
jgi:urocanate hydratase